MTRWLPLLALLLASTAQASLDADQLREQGRAALAELVERSAQLPARDQAILAVVQAPNEGLAESTLESLAAWRDTHPDDLLAKLYEGYGWLFMAGEYVKQQNYFRAAELAKRGFFLMDEAVDQSPEDWRLRLLRARLDCYVPAEFGRHVVALKDLRYLREHPEQVPAELRPLLDFLQARAQRAAGDESAAKALANQAPWGELLQAEGRLPITQAEVQRVLAPIVEAAP
jgi:hypothetical protein